MKLIFLQLELFRYYHFHNRLHTTKVEVRPVHGRYTNSLTYFKKL